MNIDKLSEASYKKQVEGLDELKNLIIELDKNILSTFLSPVIYSLVAEQLVISKSDMYKLKYILLYIFADNYYEYKAIYKFFNQIEVFIDFDGEANIIEKLKVSFSLVIVTIFSFFLSYHYLPIGVFI